MAAAGGGGGGSGGRAADGWQGCEKEQRLCAGYQPWAGRYPDEGRQTPVRECEFLSVYVRLRRYPEEGGLRRGEDVTVVRDEGAPRQLRHLPSAASTRPRPPHAPRPRRAAEPAGPNEVRASEPAPAPRAGKGSQPPLQPAASQRVECADPAQPQQAHQPLGAGDGERSSAGA